MRLTTTCLFTGLLVVAFVCGVWAETAPGEKASQEDLKKLAGYVDFDASEILGEVKTKVEVLLERPMLQMLVAAVKEEEPELAELLSALKLIRVQVFEGQAEDGEKISEKIAELVKGLKEKQGWSTFVSVTEDGEKVDILMKTANNKIQGLSLFVQEPKELVFINIAGEIDTQQLGSKVGRVFNKLLEGKLDMSQFQKLLEGLVSSEPTLNLTGVVKDAKTGKPIAGAKVTDDGYGPKPYKGAVTDAAGKYRYKTWPEEHNIVATAPGYKPQRKTLTTGLLQKEKETVLNFELEPE